MRLEFAIPFFYLHCHGVEPLQFTEFLPLIFIFRYNIDTHDYTVKMKAARGFLEDGHRVIPFISSVLSLFFTSELSVI